MAPPCFGDLGKQTRDIFSKNYHIDLVKLECKTKTDSGVNFTMSGTSHSETGRVNAFMETKYFVKDYGLTIKEKWTTTNTLTSELTVEDQITKGLKLGAESNFTPQNGKKSGVVSTSYKNDHLNFTTDVNVDEGGPAIHSSGVIHYQGWLTGGQLSFDPFNAKLKKSAVGLGYSQNDFVFHGTFTDAQDFAGYLYQRVNSKLDSGMQLNWSSATNITNFSLGCSYKLGDDTTMKAKVNNSSHIGLSFSHRLRKGIQLTLSALIDSKNINQGGHKVGLGLELEG